MKINNKEVPRKAEHKYRLCNCIDFKDDDELEGRVVI